MKRTLKLCAMILVGIISALTISCKDQNDIYQGPPAEEPKEFNDFDYATEQDVTLQISYKNMGGIEASVDFEVYDQMPVEETEYTFVKKEGIEPIHADRTENDGTYNKKLKLPGYTKTLYIYTHAFYARTLLTANVENGVAIATDEVKDEGRAVARGSRAKDNYCIPVRKEGWHEFLGAYDSQNGYIDYAYKGSELQYSGTEIKALYSAQSRIINVKKACPTEYRASTDMYINEKSEISVTLLGGNTCWNSSMGYYYYKEGEAPTSLEEANIILVFPNTQDGCWINDLNAAKSTKGVERGTTVQLMYYPNIAKGGSQEGGTTVFPAGYRIGFVLATNGWTGRIKKEDKKYRAATSKGLSVDNDGKKYNQPRTAIYRYKEGDMNAVIFSFEDHTNDQNFSDVVFTLKSNPIDAITDIPEVSDNTTTAKTLKGVYAFEDLWPSKGDYDMNDVLVVSRYEKVYGASTLDKGIYEESFIFKTLENKATNHNGLGFTLVNDVSSSEIILTIGDEKAEFGQVNDVFLLTDDVKKHMGEEYKLTLKYKGTKNSTKEASNKPFIWKKSEKGNWEVHIAQEEPTILVDKNYFGKQDDRSQLDKGIYYVRKGNYPFAFFLSGATEMDISKVLDSNNESKAISELYPLYNDWATSKGTNNRDWYKK